MKLQADLTKTLFYSFLFALGGAPSIAMMIVSEQVSSQQAILSGFIGLTLVLACVLLPVILVQNSVLFFARNKTQTEKIVPVLGKLYFILNLICLLFWILFMLK